MLIVFLTFLLGVQRSYAKTEVIFPQIQVSFSNNQIQSPLSLEKQFQPNIGFLKEKTRFVVSESISAQNQHEFSERFSCELAEAGCEWLDDLDALLGTGSKTKIQSWLNEGLDAIKVEQAFTSTSNKSKLFSDLDDALSIQHRRILVDDLDNIPGLSIGNRVENSYPNGYVLENTNATLPDGSLDPDLTITYSGDVMSFVNGTADLVQLPAGSKLYRVCNDENGAFTGGYWTRTKPSNLDKVIGGTAVQPEWNSFNNLVEYTVPNGKKIWVWEGKAASQKLSNNLNLSNPHLAGGDWDGQGIPDLGGNFTSPMSNGKYSFGDFAERFLPGLIKSGSTAPKKLVFNKGDELYKIVQKGGNIDDPLPYYLSKSELDFVKQNPDKLEQVLGLPLSSNADQYDVFKVVAQKNGVTAFESTIAPTKQYAKGSPTDFYSTPGGRKQTLVIDNGDETLWVKSSSPIETIIPNSLPRIQ